MLVYGDASRTETAPRVLERILGTLEEAKHAVDPLLRHMALVAALIDGGMWVQALLDARFEHDGCDSADQPELAVLRPLAHALLCSWRSSFASTGELPVQPWKALAATHPDPVRMKLPEGYAFYALYPETYAKAARLLPSRSRVVGVRSIGTSLGAVVAAAVDDAPLLTVRPSGPPFERRLSLAGALCTRGEPVAIVDEGPGLSGSSFAAVADRVEQEGGVPHFLPSHPHPPGPKASPHYRQCWERSPRHVVSFELLEQQLPAWIRTRLGPLDGPLEELTGGRWRRLQPPPDAPVDAGRERRKFLARVAGEPWLVKFVGLGSAGQGAFERARALAHAGFSPSVAGLVHGFLLQKWEGSPGAPDEHTQGFLERLGRYLALRVERFGVQPDDGGASIPALFQMMERNVSLGLGPSALPALARFRPELATLNGQVRRVDTDNRLHRWEWVHARGEWLKTDAVDHAHAHDLVGCQDLGWDLAGARFELGLSAAARERLDRILVAHNASLPPPELRAFLDRAYLTFQLGLWTMARESASPEERPKLEERVTFYRDALFGLLAA